MTRIEVLVKELKALEKMVKNNPATVNETVKKRIRDLKAEIAHRTR